MSLRRSPRSHTHRPPSASSESSAARVEHWYEQILGKLGEAVWLGDRDERTLYANDAMERLLGYTSEELLAMCSYDFVVVEEREKVDEEMVKRRQGETTRYNLTLVAKGGERIPTQLTGSPLPGERTLAVFVDLREQLRQRKIVAELQEHDCFLARILQDSVDAIVSVDAADIIIGWNRGAELIFGYAASDVLGKHISILHPPDTTYDRDAQYIKSIVVEKGFLRDYQTERLAKEGRAIPVAITVSTISSDDGQIVGYSVIYRDISVQKKWEREVQDEFERLKQVYVELGRKGRQLESILALVELLQHPVVPEAVMSSLASHLAVMTRARVVLVSLLSPDGKELSVVQTIGVGKEWQMLPPVSVRESIFEGPLRTGRPLRIHDLGSCPTFRWKRLARKHDIRSALLLPLTVGRERYGVVSLYFTAEHPYHAIHDTYPESLAQVGAIVLHLSRERELFQEEGRGEERGRGLSEEAGKVEITEFQWLRRGEIAQREKGSS